MNRPHFSIPGQHRSGRGNDHFGDGFQAGGSSRTEIENFRQLMRTSGDLTADEVGVFRNRVALGLYLTRDAAEATASRLIDENFDLD